MKCIVCDRNSVVSEDEDDISLNLASHRSSLLSIFCKYFNSKNNRNLTPSQLLSWIPSSSSSKSSNFPFCSECEDKMNDLNDLHSNLEKIQRDISAIISSMSMEIIKVVDSFSRSSSNNCGPKQHQIATSNQFISEESKSVGDFRNHVYKRIEPQVITQEDKGTKNLETMTTTTTTTTTTKSWNKLKRPRLETSIPHSSDSYNTESKDSEQERKNVDDEEAEERDSISIKNEPLSPSPVCSPFKDDDENTFDNEYPGADVKVPLVAPVVDQEEDCDSNDSLRLTSMIAQFSKQQEWKLFDLSSPSTFIPKPLPPPPPVFIPSEDRPLKPRKIKKQKPLKQNLYDAHQTYKNFNTSSSLLPNPKQLDPNLSPYERETFPGSNVFIYFKWEYAKISDTTYKCQTCGVIREGKQNIRMHIKRVHNDVLFHCEACGGKWANQESKDRHHCKPVQRRVKCVDEVAPGKFLYIKKFLYQKVDKSSNEEGLEFMCLNGACRKLTRTQSFMHVHCRQCHDDLDPSLICPVCGKTTTTPSVLKEHMLTHSDTRDKVCDICGKGFKNKPALRSHRARHQGGFACGFQGCNRSYTNPASLRRHRKDADHPAPKKSHKIEQCPHCSRTFVGEERLDRHISSLKCIIRSAKCQFCSKEMLPSTLKIHLRKYCPLNPDITEPRVKLQRGRKKRTPLSGSEDDRGEDEQHQQHPPAQPGPSN